MPPMICSDDEVDRLLRSVDPVNRGALEVDTVADARNALRDVVAREALVGHPRDGWHRGRSRVRLRGRGRRRFAVVAASVAGLTAAFFAANALLPQQQRGSGERSFGPAPASATVVLERAAYTARRQPAVSLTAHQYEYLKTLNGLTSSGGSSDSAGHRFGVRFWQTNTTQLWLKRSGEKRVRLTDLRERFFAARDALIARAHGMTLAQLDHVASDQGSDVIWPPNPYVHGLGGGGGFFGPALPTGPAALLRAIKEEVRTINTPPTPSHAINSTPTPAGVFSLITGRLLIDATSPTLRSALFSVVAHLPGVRLLGQRRDEIGRRGIAVMGPGASYTGQVMIFDPNTSRVLETELIYPKRAGSGTPGAPSFPAGTPNSYTVYLSQAIVNSIEDLPNGQMVSDRDAQKVIYEKRR
jgi:hypothetical protein